MKRSCGGPSRSPRGWAGCELEPGLTERLLDDIQGQPGTLPLLEFALQQLWDRRQGRRITVEAYRAIGQLEGALKNHAEAVLARFSPDTGERDLCRRVFLQLIEPGEGAEDTRRRVAYESLVTGARAATLSRIVDELVRARLLVTDTPDQVHGSVEVVHEALIRGWPTLQHWINSSRDDLRTRRRLEQDTRDWNNAAPKDRPEYLIRGARLVVASEWANKHPEEVQTGLIAAFLTASQEAENQRQAEEEKRKAEELEQARRLAEVERRRAEEQADAAARLRRRAWWLGATAAATVLIAIVAVVLVLQRHVRQL